MEIVDSGILKGSPSPIGIIEIRMIMDNAAPKIKSSKTYPLEISALFIIDSIIPHSSSMRKYS